MVQRSKGAERDSFPLLDRVHEETDRIQVLRGFGSAVDWLYGNDQFRLGVVAFDADAEGEVRRYRRNLDADEIQYQISGIRKLISQRGIVELGPSPRMPASGHPRAPRRSGAKAWSSMATIAAGFAARP